MLVLRGMSGGVVPNAKDQNIPTRHNSAQRCVLPVSFWCNSSKSTGKETGKTYHRAVCFAVTSGVLMAISTPAVTICGAHTMPFHELKQVKLKKSNKGRKGVKNTQFLDNIV